MDALYNNLACPICDKNVQVVLSWVCCRKENKNICLEHCYQGCDHHKWEHCTYKHGNDTGRKLKEFHDKYK